MIVLGMKPEERISLIESFPSYWSKVEKRLSQIEDLEPARLAVFIYRNARGDLWYSGKPTAYADSRMSLAVISHGGMEEAKRKAEIITYFAEEQIFYEVS